MSNALTASRSAVAGMCVLHMYNIMLAGLLFGGRTAHQKRLHLLVNRTLSRGRNKVNTTTCVYNILFILVMIIYRKSPDPRATGPVALNLFVFVFKQHILTAEHYSNLACRNYNVCLKSKIY